VKILVKALIATLLIGTIAVAAPAKHGSSVPTYATIDGWTPWASSITPPPPPTR
jgi:hypothetical protein